MTAVSNNPDKSTIEPVYIVTIQDPDVGLRYIKTRKSLLNFFANHIDIRGCFLTKIKANKLREVKNKEEIDRELSDDQIHWQISYQYFVKSENITFNGIVQRNK